MLSSLSFRIARRALLALPVISGAAFVLRPAHSVPTVRPQAVQPRSVRAYRFARLVDGTGAITPDAVIVVANGQIQSVGSGAAAIPKGVPLTDLRPLSAIPGLVDLHTHVTYWWDRAPGTKPFGAATRRTPSELAVAASDNGRLTLETGVTTARDLGASGYADVRMKERFARGDAIGPRLIVAGFGLQKVTPQPGAPVATPVPNAPPGWRRSRIATLSDIDSAVKAQVDSGADVIKMYGSRGTGADTSTTQTFTYEEMRAAVLAAKRYNRRIAIHSYGASGGRDAVRAGATTLEHAIDLDDSTLALMRAQGTIYVPTMDHNRYYADFRRDYGYSDAQADGLDAYRARNLATTRRAIRAGVKVGMGSDAVHMMFGQNTRELGLLVQAGMTPVQALRAGTLTGAEALGMEDRIGRVAPGYLADIVAVEGNPATSVQAVIGGVRWVMKDGLVLVDHRDDAPLLDSLAIAVSRTENRAVVFTNKRAAYFYTQSHVNDHPEHAWFRGLNIAGRRVFNDYTVQFGDAVLDPATADVVVYPDRLERRYAGGVRESLRLFDGVDVVEVRVDGGIDARLRLRGDLIKADGGNDALSDYRSQSENAPTDFVAVARAEAPGGTRHYIAVAPSREAARALAMRAVREASAWTDARQRRLTALLTGDHALATSDPSLTKAMRWITLTTDALITRQRGDGIYAGLPWFNEYWGRDSFISLAGTALVTGHFAEARAILTSFAQFQERDPATRFYGRLPNIVKPGSLDYHTTDGTPWWVIALQQYAQYSGDRTLVRRLYPQVKASITGALQHFTDSAGYLVHADNETWMDARREPDKVAYVPRGTRANDIQALWVAQLEAGATFARMNGDAAFAATWSAHAARVRTSFARDFVDAGGMRLADHIDGAGVAEYSRRPNQLFALSLVRDDMLAAKITRSTWESLVYPWGTATLYAAHPFFHPYHVAWEHYHKDEAYHNGTVWPWLNGVAIQRLIGFGQQDAAWPLFAWNANLALSRGVVGGLPENLDAFPHPGEPEPRLTGTFLQAWSNAEQLRVWYQQILGVQPDLLAGQLRLAPRAPSLLGDVRYTLRVGTGTLSGRITAPTSSGDRQYAYLLRGQAVTAVVDIVPFPQQSVALLPGDSLLVWQTTESLRLRRRGTGGTKEWRVSASPARGTQQAEYHTHFSNLRFAKPDSLGGHPVMSKSFRQ